MSKLLASETPFSIGGLTRPPLGPQGVAIVAPAPPFGLILEGAAIPEKKVGANIFVAGTQQTIGLNGALYPAGINPGVSAVTAQEVMIKSNCNSNTGFNDGAQGYTVTITVFEADGVTGIPCVSPTPDPNNAVSNIFAMGYTLAVSNDAALNGVRGECPILTATTRKLAVNTSLAAQTVDGSSTAEKFFFLPAAEVNPAGFVIKWDVSLTTPAGRITLENFRQKYVFVF